MEKHWKYSKHFAERFVERFGGTVKNLKEITCYFNNHVLQCVFDCHVRGFSQRVKIGEYTVCYRWDEHLKKLIITTVY